MRWARCFRAAWLAAVLGLGCSGAASHRTGGRAPSTPARPEDGVALYHEGRFAEAEAALVSFTSKHSENPEGWAFLGLTRVKLEKADEGEGALRRALALDPENAEAHYGIGLLRVRSGKLDEAIAELEHAVRSNPYHPYAHYYLGLAYHEKGIKDSAILHLQRFVDLAPDAPEAPRIRRLLAGMS